MSGEDAVYELTVDQPNLPKGELVQIPGLGTFKNGSSYPVTKAEADAYRTYHSKVVTVDDKDDEDFGGSRLELGPTLLQASKTMYGVEVVTSEAADTKTEKRQAASSAVTTKDQDTSKSTPNEQQVKLQNEKDPNTGTKSTEGGANS